MVSRRQFLERSVAAALVTSQPDRFAKESHGTSHAATGDISLNGEWRFRIDPGNVGTNENWAAADSVEAWGAVTVPHTWQIDSAHCDYRGIAWYRREFDALPSWSNSAVRLEFEAVFHTATVWVNGKRVGEHARRGYTAFAVDIATALRWDQPNVIAVRVDNGFNERMLPRGRSSDWAHDGGIFRPVRLLVTSKTFIERVEVEAIPDLRSMDASLTVSALCWNTSTKPWTGTAAFHIFDEVTGRIVASSAVNTKLVVSAGTSATVTMRETLTKAKLWHFDSPHLYRIKFQICDGGQEEHEFETTFGVRKFEIREGKFHLNGEAVRLMGVERMAGSNPTFGMAEPSDWIEHDHCDLKRLNCVFTRVHWPQDKRVLDYCDRHGILMQTEVPTWGPETFKGMGAQPDADIMENGLQQLREMIQRDRNHPSIVAWGLCNEIGGQNPPAYQFAKRMLQEAKQLDPGRLCSYASHSLGQTPERDVAGLMDFIEANEYFGTWQPGDARDLDKHLDKLHQTFPGKPIVISEYGYCACTPDRPEGDGHRIEIMKAHDEVIRSKDFVGGAIFFCYNDYRTHVGDRGTGALQQRVHGVVDVYGEPKASYTVLREESSPLESLTIENYGNAFRLELKTRRTIPSYTLRGYKLRGVFYGQGEIPVESQEVVIPEVSPGQTVKLDLMFTQSESPLRVRFEVMRPTQFSAYSAEWKPMKATG